jgi:hypothetical protein
VPVVVPLVTVRSLGVVAPSRVAAGLSRSVLAQVVGLHDPAEVLPLVVVAGHEGQAPGWGWTAPFAGAPPEVVELPSSAAGEALRERVGCEAEQGRHVVVLVPELTPDLERRASALLAAPVNGSSLVWFSIGQPVVLASSARLAVDPVTGLGELTGCPSGTVVDVVPATLSASVARQVGAAERGR